MLNLTYSDEFIHILQFGIYDTNLYLYKKKYVRKENPF